MLQQLYLIVIGELMANCLASENLSCDLIVIMFIIILYNYMHNLLTFWIFTPDLFNCYHEAMHSCKAIHGEKDQCHTMYRSPVFVVVVVVVLFFF